MQSQSLLEKITSKYIIENLFKYIQDNIYFFKIAKYHKRLQGFFNLGIEDYKTKSYEVCNYQKFEDFLYSKRGSKKYLKKIFNDDLKKYDEIKRNVITNEFPEIFFINKYNYYKNNEPIKKSILDNQLIIDIYSPFFEKLSKIKIFQDLFIIRIPIPFITKNDYMKYYIKNFEKLNESKIEYSSLYFQYDSDTDIYLSDIQKFNIDYGKIKKLIFEEKIGKNTYEYEELLLFKTLITNNSIVNNLIFLEIKNVRYRYKSVVYDLENLNNFKCLEELRLENVFLSKNYTLKLNSLKHLALCNCDQISISENCALNLKSLSLFRSSLNRFNSSYLKFPELEQLKISFCLYDNDINNNNKIFDGHIQWYQEFKQKIDLKSLKKLKYLFRGDISLLLCLENVMLEKAYISSYTLDYLHKSDIYKEFEKKMIKKLIDIKTLREIKLNLSFINSDDIEKIEGENTSVKKLIIDWKMKNDDNVLNKIQKKFPNLTELEIYDCLNTQKINLTLNCKIERLKYSGGFDYKEISIDSFENLKVFELKCFRSIENNNIPIFNDKYDNDFKSLIKFTFDNSNITTQKIDLKIINNIIKNIKKIPSLKCFIFKCYSGINRTDYKEIIKKILQLKIKTIEFGINSFYNYKGKIICNDEYTELELKSLFEGVDFKYFDKIKIFKFYK